MAWSSWADGDRRRVLLTPWAALPISALFFEVVNHSVKSKGPT